MSNDDDHCVMAFQDLPPWGELEEELQDKVKSPFVPSPSDTADRIIKLANVSSNDVFLDIGCGDGGVCWAMYKAVKGGCKAYGIDINSLLVEEANAKRQPQQQRSTVD